MQKKEKSKETIFSVLTPLQSKAKLKSVYWEGCVYQKLKFWLRKWALIRGRALIRAWVLIRGNTAYYMLNIE